MWFAASEVSGAWGAASASGLTIREAQWKDAVAIARVQVDTSRRTYRRLVSQVALGRLSFAAQLHCWQRHLRRADPEFTVHVAEGTSGVVGFAAAGPTRVALGEYDSELLAIYVLRANQGCGVGQRLFQSVVSATCRRGEVSLIAWVIATNPHRGFFEALGGRQVAIEIARGPDIVSKVAYGWRRLTPSDSAPGATAGVDRSYCQPNRRA